jgi:membrane-bound lytic murein transglycosylase B
MEALLDTNQKVLETSSTLLYPRNHLGFSSTWFGIAVWTFVWLFCGADLACGKASTKPVSFKTLQERLVREGFDRSFVQALYARPEATFGHKGITAYFLHRESTLNYGQFLSKRTIGKASAYLTKHTKAFEKTLQQYGVEAEVITAILLVESRLGTHIGRHPVFITFSNMAAIGDATTRDMVWDRYIKAKASDSKEDFDKWAARKSAWAFGELKAYLKYVDEQNMDPFSMKGSYAGALGFAQFIPSSVLRFGKDGDQDGKINLYQHNDAIESVANYLKQHGWKPGLTRKEAFRILLRYNNSKYYANTILDVAKRLEKAN